MQKADMKHEEKLFDLRAESVALDIVLNRPQEWEITARDSEQVCSLVIFKVTGPLGPLCSICIYIHVHVHIKVCNVIVPKKL